jgi:hypothetical protein
VEKMQLYYWLAAEASPAAVYFRDRREVDAALPELLAEDIAIFELDAGGMHTIEDLYRLFAADLQMPLLRSGTQPLDRAFPTAKV